MSTHYARTRAEYEAQISEPAKRIEQLETEGARLQDECDRLRAALVYALNQFCLPQHMQDADVAGTLLRVLRKGM